MAQDNITYSLFKLWYPYNAKHKSFMTNDVYEVHNVTRHTDSNYWVRTSDGREQRHPMQGSKDRRDRVRYLMFETAKAAAVHVRTRAEIRKDVAERTIELSDEVIKSVNEYLIHIKA